LRYALDKRRAKQLLEHSPVGLCGGTKLVNPVMFTHGQTQQPPDEQLNRCRALLLDLGQGSIPGTIHLMKRQH
jgi:hypothetical protein